MSAADMLRFAGSALTGHRLRSVLSLLGVTIGVASVVLLTSLGEGARRYVVGEFSALGTNLLVVIPGRTETTGNAPIMGGVPNDLTLADARAIDRQVPAARHVAPLSLGTARARFRERSREITVFGTTADMLRARHLEVRAGRYILPAETDRPRKVCVIGAGVARELFPDENPLGAVLRVGEERFRVVGILRPRGTSIGVDLDEVIHVPVVEGMQMFDQTSLFRILVEVRSAGAIERTKRRILDLLTERHDGEEDVTVLTQDSVLDAFGRIFGALTAALGGIAAVSLAVAGIGIMNVMLVSVSERTGEIGLLKALGASRAQVIGAFLVEAALLSMTGGALGLGLGLGAGAAIRALYPAFPVTAPAWAIVAAVVTSVAVGIGFGALPARRAARLDPVAALAGGR